MAVRTLVQNVNRIKNALNSIRSAIIAKGVIPTGDCSTYADAITSIVTTSNYNPVVVQKVLNGNYGIMCKYYEGYSSYITYSNAIRIGPLDASTLTTLVGKTVANSLTFYRRTITFNQAGTYRILSTVGYTISSYSDVAQVVSFIARDYADDTPSIFSAYANKLADTTLITQITDPPYSAMELNTSDDIVVDSGDILYEYFAVYSSGPVGIREITIKEA